MQRDELRKGRLLRAGDRIIRILGISEEEVFYIDCIRRTMPTWEKKKMFYGFGSCTIEELCRISGVQLPDYMTLSPESQRIVHERYTLIAAVIPFAAVKSDRNRVIDSVAQEYGVSKQTVRHYLCLFLAYQDVTVLAPSDDCVDRALSEDEKTMRWALNQFYYTRNKNSLPEAFTMMVTAKYTNANGQVMKHPTFNQFRYFYRKHRKLQTVYISREGVKSYERDNRPLLGDGIQQYMPYVGIGMLDATVCDIYLVNEGGGIIGRPILTACIDGFSSICLGYSLQWEGGIYSVRNLMKNILADKVVWCRERGVLIEKEVWNCDRLPGVFITDAGSEYRSETFGQITELGVTVINLETYRPDLKGGVEKFFDLVQDNYKPYLKGKGVIEPDYQERGVHDYRKDACLTMEQFEKIVLRCIEYYNSGRVISEYPFTDEMISDGVQPYANSIFEWGCQQISANFIDADYETVMLTLLPRAEGRFSRRGLKVNGMRYKADGFTEDFLRGGTAVVAYNPDDVSMVWLLRRGEYIPFELIESRYRSKSLAEVEAMESKRRELVRSVREDNLQARVDLANHIEAIASLAERDSAANIRDIRVNRQRERRKTHKDVMKGGQNND